MPHQKFQTRINVDDHPTTPHHHQLPLTTTFSPIPLADLSSAHYLCAEWPCIQSQLSRASPPPSSRRSSSPTAPQTSTPRLRPQRSQLWMYAMTVYAPYFPNHFYLLLFYSKANERPRRPHRRPHSPFDPRPFPHPRPQDPRARAEAER